MYGGLSSTFRSGGTRKRKRGACGPLKPRSSPKSSGALGATPGPSCGTPALEKLWPPNSGPKWHEEQRAFVKKRSAPCFASVEIALSSRAMYRSKGELVNVKAAPSKAAMAFAACWKPNDDVGTPGNAALNLAT